MANYTIIMSCGHEGTVSLYGKYSERQRKIEYFQNKGLCKQCYKKKMEEEMMTETLTFHASVLPYIDEVDGGLLLYVWFDWNTKPYKDKIKLIGG